MASTVTSQPLKGQVVLRGGNAGASRLYAYRHNRTVYSSTSLPDLLNHMRKHTGGVEVDADAIPFLLHNSLVPPPQTAFKDVWVLGIGDVLAFPADGGQPHWYCDFPYFSANSTERSKPSTKTLLNLLCRSVEDSVNTDATLMMSSGKDSVALALALAESGKAATSHAYTYTDDGQPVDESADAARLAKKLGIAHTTITLPRNPKEVKKALQTYFAGTSYLTCDPTIIPYVMGMHQAGVGAGGTLVDGTRNDIYMGITASPQYVKLCKYYKAIGGGFTNMHALRALVPFHTKAVKFLSTYPEVNLYKHGHLRLPEIRKVYPTGVQPEVYWKTVYNAYRHLNMEDLRGYIIGQYFDGASVMLKAPLVAETFGLSSTMPWAYQPLADYYFNLPREARFNTATQTNKVLLRQLLKEKLGYDASAIGKRIFYFNMHKFVAENMDFIRDEIMACKLWPEKARPGWQKHLDTAKTHPRAAGAVIDAFLVSGWHNHNRYLNP